MDVAGNVIGLFMTAYSAYKTISAAIEVGSDRFIWNVLMRIEKTRFEIWGRTLGFLDEKTGKPLRESVVPRLDTILQIEAARGLVLDILKSITALLQEFEKSADSYNLNPDKELAPVAAPRKQGKSKRWNKLWNSTKDFTVHLLLVVKDENMMNNLLKRLTEMNNGLEKVLSLLQKTEAAKALHSEVLKPYSTLEHLDAFVSLADEPSLDEIQTAKSNAPTSSLSRHPTLVATARVKRRCVEMTDTAHQPEQTKSEIICSKRHEPYSMDVGDFKISLDNLRLETPQRNKDEVQWPNGLARYSDPDGRGDIPVLIEWRQQATISPGFEIPEDELTVRRNLLVRLLHETSNLEAAVDYRVLDCLGYCKCTGRVEGEPIPVIGFLAKIPSWADATRQPISLQKILRDSFQSEDVRDTPSLRDRFQLARQITTALYQLQCSSWLHRNLSSDQIVFFYERPSPSSSSAKQPRLDEPFLVGLQYSRPDDQSPIKRPSNKSEGFKGLRSDPNWGRLGLYLHPDFSGPRARRYQRSDDVYSLGIILFEIAFWEPVEIFSQGAGETVPDAATKILDTARAELAAETGEFYRDAVLGCLEGLRGPVRKEWLKPNGPEWEEIEYQGKFTAEDPEYGLEQDLMWKVLREIGKCTV